MKKDLDTPNGGAGWKDQLLGVVILVAMIGGLVYVNAFASIGETLAVGVVVAAILLALRAMRKKQPERRETNYENGPDSNRPD